MIIYGYYGTFEVDLPAGYEQVSSGEVILDGDLYLEGGKYYSSAVYLAPVWTPFENPTLVTRVVSPEMIIIRAIP